MKNIITLLLLTSVSAGLFASDTGAGGESPRTVANKKWMLNNNRYAVMLENNILWPMREGNLTYAKAREAMGSVINNDALQIFFKDNCDEICKIAQNIINAKQPTVSEFENAFVSLQLMVQFGLDDNRNSARALLTTLEDTHWRIITNAIMIEVSDATSQKAIENGLAACDILPRLGVKLTQGKGADAKAVNLQEWADRRRPELQARLKVLEAAQKSQKKNTKEDDEKSKVLPLDDEEFGLDTPKSWWSKTFTPKRLMTIGSIALVAAALYYFGYAKKDAKANKGNTQAKK